MVKRIFVILCILGFIYSICLAGQLGSVNAGGTPAKAVPSKEIRGKVEEVVLEDLVNEVRPKITIVAADGLRHTFVIRPITTIYDPGWNPTTLDKIAKGQFVRIKYRVNKEGYTVALSIKPSKAGPGAKDSSGGLNKSVNHKK